MSNKEKNTLIPKLRFSKLPANGVWNEENLGAIAEIIEERAGINKYSLMSVTSGIGLISQIEKFGREIAGDQYKNYYVIKKWDFAYNKSATKQYPEGYIAMLKDIDSGAVPNSIFTCFRIIESKIIPQFLDYLFQDNFHGKWLRRFIEVGARAHGSLSIDDKVLLKMPINFPSPEDQQKIADCLSSLDDYLTAQSQKLEALKAYKKGLMQQLFPAEGETVPKLRFKEFRGSGEWEEKMLEEILIEGKLGGNYENSEANSGIPVIKMGNLGRGFMNIDKLQYLPEDAEYNQEDILRKGDLFLNTRNTLELVGKVAIWREELSKALYNSNLLRMTFNSDLVVTNYFMNYCFNTPNTLSAIRSIATGTTSVAAIYTKDLLKLKLTIPFPQEQKKIADCLSSLDELITEQAKKILELKEHKKGLMQGLFPASVPVKNTPEIAKPVMTKNKERKISTIKLSDEEKRDLLGGYIISKADLNKNFGHIKFVKQMVTAEYYAETEMPTEYHQHNNGPYDKNFMQQWAYRLKQKQWFEEFKAGRGFSYKPLAKAGEIEELFAKVFPDKKETIDHVITLMNRATPEQAEILATVYAVWNDLLINEMQVSASEIKKYFFRWSEHKRKSFTPQQVEGCYKWMIKENFIPKGKGRLIMNTF